MFVLFTSAANYKPSIMANVSGFIFLYQAIFIAAAVYMLIKLILKKEVPVGKILVPLALILGYLIISLLWTPDLYYGANELGIVIQGYVIYLFIRNDEKSDVDFYKLSWFLTLLLLVISVQYFVITIKHIPFEGKGPLYVLWANPNIVAAFFGISFVPSLYKYFVKGKTKLRFLYLPLELLVLYGIYFTLSEGLYVALIVGLIFIPIQLLIKNKKMLYFVTLTAIMLFATFIIVVIANETRWSEFYNDLDIFSTGRLSLYNIGLQQLKNPLVLIFGRGSGSAKPILVSHGYGSYYFHSFVLNIVVQRGLVSLVVTFFMFYQILVILKTEQSLFKYFASIGVITYLAHGVIDIGFEYQFIGVLFYLIVASVEKHTYDSEVELVIN